MKKLFLLLMTVFAITLSASAQRTVTGTVVSAEDNEPLAGASVVPVGGGQGGATDINGNFSVTVAPNASKLRVSYVGFETQTVAIKPGKMEIKLVSSDNKLDEVMVVAYGTAKKSAFTGSATVVGEAEIEKVQVTNVLDALSGVVPGVQINNASGAPGGGNPSILIRGISSINASNTPLYVVDGTPYSGDINNFSAADIESMTVLKDAASNALYGARGANGVILITTKKGKTANATVTLDAKWGCNSRAQQDYKTINDPARYYEMYYRYLYNYALNNQGMTPAAANAYANANMVDPSGSNNMSLGYNAFALPEGELLIGMDGKINPAATLGNIINYGGKDYLISPDNWLDDAYQRSLRQEYNVSVASGNDKGSFYASFSWLNNDGIVKGSGYQRLTGTLRGDIQAKSWLKVGGNMNYTRYKSDQLSEDGESNSSANVFAAATQVAPIYPLYLRNPDGSIMIDAYGNQMYDYGDGMNAGLSRPVFASSNAIGDSRLNVNKYEGNAFNVTAFVEVRFLKDFKFTSNNNMSLDETRSTEVTNPYYGLYASSNGITYISHGRSQSYAFQQLLTWNHMFGLHNVSALAGHENYWSKSYTLYGGKSNMFDPNNYELAGAITDITSNSSTGAYNNEGYLFRAQYDYDSRYFLSASFRRDASSRFHPDHRWGNFWSVGAAWNINKESFMQPYTWINLLKIKASYGEQGNDRIGDYRYTNTYTLVNAAGYPAAKPYTYGNPDITWEKGGNFNAGVEFGFWNNRLSGQIEGFYRKTSDMLFSFPLAPSFGFSSYYANIGDMSNAGVEIELNGTLYEDKDWHIGANANLTYYKNKIIRLPEERRTATADGVEGFPSGNYFFGEGESYATFYLPRYAGTDKTTGEALYWKTTYDADGNPNGQTVTNNYASLTTDDYHLCGKALPDCYGGFGLNASWRWFDFSIDFNYQIGGQIYDSQYASMMSSPNTNGGRGEVIHEDMLNAWSAENPSSNIPRAQYGDQYSNSSSDRWLTTASYLSLRSLNFGFTMPQSVTAKLKMQRIRFYLTCDNLAFWSARKGMDPRQSVTGGASNSYYSPIRTVSGGINVTF